MHWSPSQVRDFLLRLPEVEPSEHHSTPDLRVRNRIIATFPAERGEMVVLKCTPLNLDMLTREPGSAYRDMSGGRWLGVDLLRAPAHQVAELAVEAYCLAAPRRLAAQVRANPDPLAP